MTVGMLIKAIFQSLLFTTVLATVGIVMREKLHFKKLLVYFFVLLFGLLLIMAWPVEAQIQDDKDVMNWAMEQIEGGNSHWREDLFDIQAAITVEQRQELFAKAQYHTEMAAKTLQEAMTKCSLLPDKSTKITPNTVLSPL